jgi:hypothetical protein
MKSKSFLVTVYYDNNQDEYFCDPSIAEVIRNHINETNEDVRIVDVAIDTDYSRILAVTNNQINDPL